MENDTIKDGYDKLLKAQNERLINAGIKIQNEHQNGKYKCLELYDTEPANFDFDETPLVIKALLNACTRRDRFIWYKYNTEGVNQTKLGKLLGLSRVSINTIINKTRQKINKYIKTHEQWLGVYQNTLRMHHLPVMCHNCPLPRKIEAAREILEDNAWETMCLEEDMSGMTYRIRITKPIEGSSEYVLTQNKLVKFAQEGCVYLGRHKRTIYL